MVTGLTPILSTPDLPRLLAFYTGGLDALEVAGTLASPPTDMPWGERVADLHDPDGNLVHVAHPLG
jgi:catechol 2,3-dioxygenase-like lactoylglutathione lyase family enzyme